MFDSVYRRAFYRVRDPQLHVFRPNLRHSARGVILTDDNRLLLCRHVSPGVDERAVWAAPGGGIESGETLLMALRRELREEVGLTVNDDPPHVWHQTVIRPGHPPGYDGVINDYFLVRVAWFTPCGSLSPADLAAETIGDVRWWSLTEISSYQGSDLFSPRDLATPLANLINRGIPPTPVEMGL